MFNDVKFLLLLITVQTPPIKAHEIVGFFYYVLFKRSPNLLTYLLGQLIATFGKKQKVRSQSAATPSRSRHLCRGGLPVTLTDRSLFY